MKVFLLLIFCIHFSVYANATTSKQINLILDNNTVIGKYTVSVESLNIRESPSMNAAISGRLKQGDHVFVLSSKNNWRMIQVNKTFGWVSARHLSFYQ
ncbi:SH3 domain-containing protein [Photobacterium nomapromontoriensis]|uniref:SH3 domain-containing protein n=1 Tax=Photobacterium nomapromontoriensis TaxID=2910237 RepID=UPI003D13814A